MIIMITGASRGIGFETVKAFARNKDMEIYALSRNAKALDQLVKECRNLNEHAHVYPLAFNLELLTTDPASLVRLLPAESFHPDILINNAGQLINKSFTESTFNDIGRMFQANCIAPALLIRTLIPFISGKTAHVVNITSMGGFQGSKKFAGLAWYSASKAALTCLTECLQEEFKDTDIAFNCLALGSVQTEMLQEAFPGYNASVQPAQMAEFIMHFALTAHQFMKGKIIPVSLSNP
jgi:short-subunit dehydrogenase